MKRIYNFLVTRCKLRRLLCFLLFAFCFFSAQAQYEFAPIGAEWYYNYSIGVPENHFNHIVSEKDTTIDGSNCRILNQYYDKSDIASEKYIIKQEEGKIYHYYQGQFHLLFNFDAQINDTVILSFMYKYHIYDDDLSIIDTIFTARFKIEDITTNAQNLKTFNIAILDEDVLVDTWGNIVPHYTINSYTEKIGFHTEFMPIFANTAYETAEHFWWLRCYSDDNFSIISDNWIEFSFPCNYCKDIGINTNKDEDVNIYPNPFNNNVFVFTNNGGNIKIIDIFGKIVYNSELLDGLNEISTNNFSKGIYFVKVNNNNNNKSYKIVKL